MNCVMIGCWRSCDQCPSASWEIVKPVHLVHVMLYQIMTTVLKVKCKPWLCSTLWQNSEASLIYLDVCQSFHNLTVLGFTGSWTLIVVWCSALISKWLGMWNVNTGLLQGLWKSEIWKLVFKTLKKSWIFVWSLKMFYIFLKAHVI